jgi:transposase InsO family protein
VIVQGLVEWHKYPVGLACQLVDLPRSSFYYKSWKADESYLEGDLKTVAGQFPTYGTRRITHQLRRSPHRYHFNRKHIQRLMRKLNLLQPVKHKKCRTTNSDHPYPRYLNLVKDLVVASPEQVWVSDITYIRLGEGFVYLAIVMDVFTRAILGWHLSKSLDQDLTLAALRIGLTDHIPQMHHSDQGIQYAVEAYIDMLTAHEIQICMATVGKAEENGYAERLMRTIKEEEVDLSDYRDFADAHTQIGNFIEDVYNHKRIHSSLGYLTPAEFELAYRLALTQSVDSTP